MTLRRDLWETLCTAPLRRSRIVPTPSCTCRATESMGTQVWVWQVGKAHGARRAISLGNNTSALRSFPLPAMLPVPSASSTRLCHRSRGLCVCVVQPHCAALRTCSTLCRFAPEIRSFESRSIPVVYCCCCCCTCCSLKILL